MRISDNALTQLRDQGYTIVADFLTPDELSAAQFCMWQNFPTPDTYFADPDAHAEFSRSQFAGLRLFPYVGWALNRLAFHPDLVNAAERYLGSTDLELYKVELWANDYQRRGATMLPFSQRSLIDRRAPAIFAMR